MFRLLPFALVLYAHAVMAQVRLEYVSEKDDAMDTTAVLIRSTRDRGVLMEKARTWLQKELPGPYRDTIVGGDAMLKGRPVMKLSNWVIASSVLVEKRTLEFDLSIWFEGDSLQCAMSKFIYSHAKGKGMRSVPLTDWYRKYHRKNQARIKQGKDPKPKHDELVDMDRSLYFMLNRLANTLAD
jgi:hypothetical protein